MKVVRPSIALALRNVRTDIKRHLVDLHGAGVLPAWLVRVMFVVLQLRSL